MKLLILAGLQWRAHSPSRFELVGLPVWLAFNGHHWFVATSGTWGERAFTRRDEAAAMVAKAYAGATEGVAS